MWIFTKNGFVSAVAHDTDPDVIRVRARKQEHLLHSFGPVTVLEMPDADYRWHTEVSRADFIEFLTEAALDLRYTSHVKEEIAGDDNEMYQALLGCWTAMHRLQEPWDDDDEYMADLEYRSEMDQDVDRWFLPHRDGSGFNQIDQIEADLNRCRS